MHQISEIWLAHQRARFTRPDAHRWWRCDAARYRRFDSRFHWGRSAFDEKAWAESLQAGDSDREWQLALHRAREQLDQIRHECAQLRNDLLRRKSWEDQPRVPAGSPEGGQWASSDGQNEPQILSDATPDDEWKPGAQYAAANRPIRGQFPGATPGQNARLAAAELRADAAIRRVQEVDPTWQPRVSSLTAPNDIEGAIGHAAARAEAAEARLGELRNYGILPGPYAIESIPARGPSRDFNAWERAENNRIGAESGCHTCGTFTPGTLSGNFVLDHQPPGAWNPRQLDQRLYPHCLTCSLRQGGWIRSRRFDR